jgi:hypothetical protein
MDRTVRFLTCRQPSSVVKTFFGRSLSSSNYSAGDEIFLFGFSRVSQIRGIFIFYSYTRSDRAPTLFAWYLSSS